MADPTLAALTVSDIVLDRKQLVENLERVVPILEFLDKHMPSVAKELKVGEAMFGLQMALQFRPKPTAQLYRVIINYLRRHGPNDDIVVIVRADDAKQACEIGDRIRVYLRSKNGSAITTGDAVVAMLVSEWLVSEERRTNDLILAWDATDL